MSFWSQLLINKETSDQRDIEQKSIKNIQKTIQNVDGGSVTRLGDF